MSVSMYTVSIPVFIKHLNGLDTILDKAVVGIGCDHRKCTNPFA
jgi:hypothetical protein